jgi:hypothetical protein
MPRLRSALAFVLATIVWASSASAAEAAGWLEGPTFGDDGVPAFADLDVAASGAATVGWVEPIVPGGEPTMHLRRIGPDGTPGGIRTLGAAEPDEPSVALTPRGDGFVVWVGDDLAVNYAAVDADGDRGATHALGTTVRGWASAAIDDAGTATIAWLGAASGGTGEAIHLLRVRPDGSRTPVRELPSGPDDMTDSLRVAVAPDGTSWATWSAPGPTWSQFAVWAARIDAAGAVAAGPQALSAPSVEAMAAELTASASGAALTWVEEDADDVMRMLGVRLPAGGALSGETLGVVSGMSRAPAATTSAIAPDGTVTAVWPVQGTGSSLALAFRSFPPAGSPTAPRQISTGTGDDGIEHSPALASVEGGALLLASIRDLDDGGPQASELLVRRIEGDGAVGGAQALGPVTSVPAPALLATDGSGGAIVGGYEGEQFDALKLATWLHDDAPRVDATIPATVESGAVAAFSVTATDRRGIASIDWSFGDGDTRTGAAVTHVYRSAGDRTVTVTVRDTSGEETVVSRHVKVTAPIPPVPGTPDPPRPPAARRAAARLKLGTVVRKGARVTVRGTIARSAGGRVTVTWSQKAGRRTVVRRASARIARGRWSATVRLTRALARARRGSATVRVAYAGDADTRAASARRTVRVARRAAAKRGR